MENEKNIEKPKKYYAGAAVLVLVLIAIAYRLGASSGGSSIISPGEVMSGAGEAEKNISQENQVSSGDAAQVYNYTEAPQHIGEYAAVKGKIVQVFMSNKGTIFFDFCRDYKTCPFSAVIFSSDAGKFKNLRSYEGREITIKGQIKTYQGKAEIIINSPEQIVI